jgi:hypothetical protein
MELNNSKIICTSCGCTVSMKGGFVPDVVLCKNCRDEEALKKVEELESE